MKEIDSFAVADAALDNIYDKFSQYLMMQKLNELMAPYVSEQILGVTLGTCAYMSIKSDLQHFELNQSAEIDEPRASEVEKCAGDYIKKIVKPVSDEESSAANTLEPGSGSHLEGHHDSRRSGIAKLQKAVKKLSKGLK